MSKSTLNKFLFSSAVVAGVVAVAPQESEAAVGDQVLKQGMSHQDVTELQNILKEKGFFTYHTATGYFGTYTRDAVLDYQKENNLRVDGIAGPETFGALLDKKSSNTEVKKETTTQQSHLLRIGSRGDSVTNLQDELRSLGFFNQSSTGYYGSITRDAVIAFQKEQGLRLIDGIVGPETRGALNNVDAQPVASETTTTESKPAETKPAETTTETTTEAETTTEETSEPKEQASESQSSSSSAMRVGTRGENVTELQQQLRTLGYFNQEPTGYYGEITKNAVMEFQRTNGISVDGIVGSGTQSTLNGSPASASTSSSSTSESTSSNNSSSSSESTSSNNSSSSSESTSSNNSSNSSSSSESTASESSNSSSNAAAPAPSTNNNAAPATNTSTSNTSTASSSNVVSGLISSAQSVIGVPYLWGGTTTAGFDCSGMIQYIFRQNGLEVPRTAAAQWNAGTSVSSPSIGDIVFFETYAAGPTHNGIYIGDNKFIHTGSSRGVEVSDLNNVYWGPRYLGAKRLH